jgi:hypothetical protein
MRLTESGSDSVTLRKKTRISLICQFLRPIQISHHWIDFQFSSNDFGSFTLENLFNAEQENSSKKKSTESDGPCHEKLNLIQRSISWLTARSMWNFVREEGETGLGKLTHPAIARVDLMVSVNRSTDWLDFRANGIFVNSSESYFNGQIKRYWSLFLVSMNEQGNGWTPNRKILGNHNPMSFMNVFPDFCTILSDCVQDARDWILLAAEFSTLCPAFWHFDSTATPETFPIRNAESKHPRWLTKDGR